jgi:integrator complex subunit 11
MTHPTRAICPLLLEDYRKITVDRKGEQNFFTQADIRSCMRKVICINLHESTGTSSILGGSKLAAAMAESGEWPDTGDDEDLCGSEPQLTITAYYAGHVLGAAMLLIRYGDLSVVYTGDYNMTPDRHLGCAWIDRCRPTLLITETTYGTTIRDSKRARERDFLRKVHDCVNAGGKVLIPVFALGRAQELCILLDGYWERMGLGGKVPVYFAGGLTAKANYYYRLYTQWTNQQLKRSFAERNMFDFRHIKPFDIAYATGFICFARYVACRLFP